MDDPEIARCAVELRPRSEHGSTQVGGLRGTHHFCFATYQRVDRLEWGAVRGLNEYRLAPGTLRQPSFHSGFDIVTLVTAGTLRRLGTYAPKQLLTPGSVELVSTGRGVNLGIEAVGPERAGYIEIWIRTGPGLREPRREWLGSARTGLGRPLATGDPFVAGSLRLRAGGAVARATLAGRQKVRMIFEDSECAYLSVRSGTIAGNAISATAGDALAITGPGRLDVEAEIGAELLLVRTARPGWGDDGAAGRARSRMS